MPAAQAVEALIHDYGRLVFRVIYGLTGDYQESQDLTQDTFLQALRAIEVAQQTSGADFHAKAWLLQIAANIVRMHRRRRNLVRFVPFSSLHEERQDENERELVGERPAPVQPAGYGMGGAAGDPAEIVATRCHSVYAGTTPGCFPPLFAPVRCWGTVRTRDRRAARCT